MAAVATPEQFKDEGNAHFKAGEYLKAAASYTKARRLPAHPALPAGGRASVVSRLAFPLPLRSGDGAYNGE